MEKTNEATAFNEQKGWFWKRECVNRLPFEKAACCLLTSILHHCSKEDIDTLYF